MRPKRRERYAAETGSLRRLGIALRIARRQSLRAKGRSALIVALIALPVAGMAAVTLIIPSMQPTTAEKLRVELGQAQARVQVVSVPDDQLSQDPLGNGWGGGSPHPGDETRRTLTELFPAGTPMIPVLGTSVTATTSTGVAALSAYEGRAWDPALAGRYDVVAGTTPTQSDQVMVTASTLGRLGIQLGGQVQLINSAQQTVSVVGVIDDRTQPSSTNEFFGLPGAFTGDANIQAKPQAIAYLPDTVLDWPAVQKLNKQGAVILSRQVLEHPPVNYQPMGGNGTGIAFMTAGMVMGFALLEVTLLAGAAFTVGARAQERSLATIASVGSNRLTLFSVISANGLVLGAVGGIIGVALGIPGGSLFMRLVSNGSATQFWGYHLWWPAMIGIAAAAVVIGWIGALVPAVRASKFDVVAALRGARRPAVPSRKRPIVGVVVVALGIVMTIFGGVLTIVLTQQGTYTNQNPLFWLVLGMLLAGPVLTQLGLLLCSGLLLRLLARLLSGTGIAARLASRDAARNPGRSIPALAVIMTTVFVAVFAMTMIASSQATSRANYSYQTLLGQVELPLDYWDQTANQQKRFAAPDQFVAAVREDLDVADVRMLKYVQDPDTLTGPRPGRPAIDPKTLLPGLIVPAPNTCPLHAPLSEQRDDWRCSNHYVTDSSYGDSRGHIVVGDAKDLALILGSEPSADARNALAHGGAVSLYPEYVHNDQITIDWRTASDWEHKPFGVAGTAPDHSSRLAAIVENPPHPIWFGVIVSPATADELGLTYAPGAVLASTKTPPTQAQLDALTADIDTLLQSPGAYYANVERGPVDSAGALAWGILGLSALIAIGAAAVAIGLARFDGRRDQATLAAVGSSPRVQRGFGFWQAIVLAGTGAVLGSAVGLVPAVALTLPGSGTLFAAPWLPILATALLLPLAIACGAWLVAGRQRVELRRAAIE